VGNVSGPVPEADKLILQGPCAYPYHPRVSRKEAATSSWLVRVVAGDHKCPLQPSAGVSLQWSPTRSRYFQTGISISRVGGSRKIAQYCVDCGSSAEAARKRRGRGEEGARLPELHKRMPRLPSPTLTP